MWAPALACSPAGAFANGDLVLQHRVALCLSSRGQRIRCMNACHRRRMPCAVYQPLNSPAVAGSRDPQALLKAECRDSVMGHSECVGNILLRSVVSVPFKKPLLFSTTHSRGLALMEPLPSKGAKGWEGLRMKNPSLRTGHSSPQSALSLEISHQALSSVGKEA